MKRRIAIFTDEAGWHSLRLFEAFAARGCDPHFVPLKACHFDLSREPYAIELPGFDGSVPDAAFVRAVPGGTLEQIVFYLDVLHALSALGVPIYNDPRAVERSVDKGMTSFLLRRAGIPTPPTWITGDAERARAVTMRELAAGHELVCKPLFGAQGVGLKRVRAGDSLPPIESYKGIYYLQRYIDTGEDRWHDWRVFVIGGRAVLAMRRNGTSWISNVANGGRCQPAMLDDTLRALAESAVKATDMYYGGVDIIRDIKGQASVVEVNSIPAWKGLQSTCNVNVAELLVNDFLRHCEAGSMAEATG